MVNISEIRELFQEHVHCLGSLGKPPRSPQSIQHNSVKIVYVGSSNMRCHSSVWFDLLEMCSVTRTKLQKAALLPEKIWEPVPVCHRIIQPETSVVSVDFNSLREIHSGFAAFSLTWAFGCQQNNSLPSQSSKYNRFSKHADRRGTG